METTVKQRLIAYLKYKKIGQNKFEKIAGISNGYIHNLKNAPGADHLTKILLAAPDLIRVWLLSGEGSMLMEEQPSKAHDVPEFLSNAVRSEEVSELEYAGENKNGAIFFRDKEDLLYISVPRAEFAARGEYPNEADSLEPSSEPTRDIYKVDKKVKGRYLSFDVQGDSMDDGRRTSLQAGDKVLARELERDNWRTLRVGDHRFWVLVFGSSVLIKEIIAFNPTTGDITCHSLNPSPEYQDFVLNLDNVRHLYYVIKHQPKQNDM